MTNPPRSLPMTDETVRAMFWIWYGVEEGERRRADTIAHGAAEAIRRAERRAKNPTDGKKKG